MERLLGIIAALPTTLQDDRAALRGVTASDVPEPWVKELLQFRVARKAALHSRVAALRARCFAAAADSSRNEL